MKRSRVNPVNRERRAKNFVLAYGSEERVRWMQGFPCIVRFDDCNRKIDAAHTISKKPKGRGGPDSMVPLCRKHHTQMSDPYWGVQTFQRHYGIDLTAEAAKYAKWWADRGEGLSE